MKKKEQTLAYKLKYYDWDNFPGWGIVLLWILWALLLTLWVVFLASSLSFFGFFGVLFLSLTFVGLLMWSVVKGATWWESI